MLYQGKNLSAQIIEAGIVDLHFNAQGSVNKFDRATFTEFIKIIAAINNCAEAKGVMITSGKEAFCVGADINEFLPVFKKSEADLELYIKSSTDVFDAFEDINLPTISAINGIALGGGCELVLTCDYRIADTKSLIGLPEVTLGIMPGFGGSVRLPRIIGADNAIECITTGKPKKSDEAFALGLIDAVAEPEHLRVAAITMLTQAIDGKLDWRERRNSKLTPLLLTPIESVMTFSTCKAMVEAKAGKHYPAPMVVVNTIESAAPLDRTGAMLLENKAFAKLAKTSVATAQIGLFLSDQVLKSKVKKAISHLSQPHSISKSQVQQSSQETVRKINKAAVLGAGIMGGGIAYQSAYKGIPVVLKDINEAALQLGLTTAAELLVKQVDRGRLRTDKMAKVLNNINASLHYKSIEDVELVIEAVVENANIKSSVLAEVETVVSDTTIITSNTSTISINLLAKNLIRPQNFCGMHFFNPVHKMPLVEVIKGKNTSDETIASVVAYAAKIGKSPIVVNDCPGFYVNRVLFPYFSAFSQLLLEGVDFAVIDTVMEKHFGWPMGPAYLLDVVGLDTATHCSGVMAEGFPTRMATLTNDPIHILYNHEYLGQKNNKGFYHYGIDKRGRPTKKVSDNVAQLFSEVCAVTQVLSDDEIVARLMVPMINEVIRCLEEGIIDTAAEADMGLIYGIGFPPFRGGPIRYLETLGLDQFITLADQYADLGEIYQVTAGLREMAATKQSYFSTDVKTVIPM